jgi:hypothetical protein
MGSITEIPAASYWEALEREFPGHPVAQLRMLSDQRKQAFRSRDLGVNVQLGTALLERFAHDGWVNKLETWQCPIGAHELPEEEVGKRYCTTCQVDLDNSQPATKVVSYSRQLQQQRVVDWVVAIHGMKSRGEWQERLTWLLGTTWGRSVPVAVYKYGFVVTGVVKFWARRRLVRELRAKLVVLKDEATKHDYKGYPDVIAHSFGTWLFGHLCLAEAAKAEHERLQFGRVILYGCILRPDFNWQRLIDLGMVEAVLNHYGDKDAIVPLAHYTIWDSGPSGRRGFDSPGVINVCAQGHGHTSLFDVDKFDHGKGPHQKQGEHTESHMFKAYTDHWLPFVKLPLSELAPIGTGSPAKPWRPCWWPLRGTLFPLFGLSFLIMLLIWCPVRLIAWLGPYLLWVDTAMKLVGLGFLSYTLCVFCSMMLRRTLLSDQ